MKLEKRKGIITAIAPQRGFGFITMEDEKDIFFHYKGVCYPTFEELREGHEVEFSIKDTPKGPKAIGIYKVE